MALWLKQSTTVTIKFGPLVDAGDGNTPETGEATNLDSATTGIRLAKAGGDMGDRNSSTAPTHDEVGIYNVELNATDTATLGMLKVSYDGSTVCLPHWMEFMVVPSNVWDSMFGADNLDVNTAQVGGQTASAAGTVTFPGTIASTTNITSATGVTVSTVSDKTGYSLTATTGLGNQTANITGTITTATNVTTLNGLAANVITAASINANALDGKGDWNIGKTGYSLTQAFPTNFADLAITLTTGQVTVGTNADKTGYSISGAITTLDGLNNVAATDIVSAGAITTLAGAVANVDLVDVTTTNSDMVDNPLDAAGHRAALGLAAANLDTQLADIPTVAEFNARTQPTADYFDWTTDTVANVTLCATTTNLTNAPTNGDLTATMKTSVNTEVSDVLKTDTVTLPGQVAPPLAPTFEEMISWLYKVLRNRTDQTSSLWQLYADNETTVDAKATVSDNGTTAVKQEIVAGP
jgi:hypothetical protein